jgi:hypothetical protein
LVSTSAVLPGLGAKPLPIPEQTDHDSCARQRVIGFPQESAIGFAQDQ